MAKAVIGKIYVHKKLYHKTNHYKIDPNTNYFRKVKLIYFFKGNGLTALHRK
jgi:hypothetical protein